ncbi:MAG TPA: glutaredoxin family protein [Candidatus Saccharimonadales bacterium]|nr:glutaredoxin family protein [Candidatus Saccharimonadales bacterium]
MPKKITIYTRTTCQYCDKVKKYLTSKGYAYEAINLDDEPKRQQEALTLSGSLTVPVTVVEQTDNTKSVVVGFNLQRLVPVLTR